MNTKVLRYDEEVERRQFENWSEEHVSFINMDEVSVPLARVTRSMSLIHRAGV